MYSIISLVLTWVLFLALFPMAFIWLRRAWRIFKNKDYSEVALKGGKPPANQDKWAIVVGLLNLVAGAICVWIIIGVPVWIASGLLLGPFKDYDSWSAIAGTTIWGKILADFIIRMQAHPFKFGKDKKSEPN